MTNGYDAAITATNAGGKVRGITRLSDTGLFGGDYSQALRMIEAGLSYTYSDGTRRIMIRPAAGVTRLRGCEAA